MDTITHGLIGTLGSRTGFSQKSGRIATIAFLIGAIFPDLDIVVTLVGPDFSLRYHRGITHSLIAAPFFAIFLAALIYRFTSFKNFVALALMVVLGIYSHIFFDLITSYGTVLFDPLSMKRYSLNLVFILDPFISFAVLLGLIFCWKKKDKSLAISISVFTFLALYLILCICLKITNEEKIAGFVTDEAIIVKKSTVYPRPLAPFYWMGVIETEDVFYRLDLSIFRKDPIGFDKIAKTNDNPFIDLANNLKVASLYKWFADYPIAEYEQISGEHIVKFYDLRFNMIPKRNPFLLRVVFNNDGSLKKISLNGRYINEGF